MWEEPRKDFCVWLRKTSGEPAACERTVRMGVMASTAASAADVDAAEDSGKCLKARLGVCAGAGAAGAAGA